MNVPARALHVALLRVTAALDIVLTPLLALGLTIVFTVHPPIT
ncbi:MAG TPA: hypothetical protein VFF73_29000 [Planctomycetota bacterium]|nr:hypothetical protein [Planctomycetota bacterium]